MTGPRSTGVSALDVAASDASKDHPVTVWIRVGNTQGLVEVGQIWAPGQLPALLRATAETIDSDHAAQT
jgi:hypothetical protein